MKLLILGATGMAGHVIAIHMLEQGYDVTTFTRKTFSYGNNIIGDVENIRDLLELLKEGDYDAVVNCIGVLNQNCESNKSRAIWINSCLPHVLAEALNSTSTKLIHLSTDCVFSGQRGHYKEDAVPDGQTIYDRTKALGEVNDTKNLTFRNSIIGPELRSDGIGLFNWFMKQDGVVNGYTKVIWTGVTTLELAKAIDAALKENLDGLYHLVNNHPIDKYHLLALFNEYFCGNAITIRPYDGVILDKSLVNTRDDFYYQVPSYRTMIEEMAMWVNSHSNLYPHYFMKREV